MSNVLLRKEEKYYACNLRGLAYVKNSKGNGDNLNFLTTCTIDTTLQPNVVKVQYEISAFEGKNDEIKELFDDYSTAIDRYNELVTEWSAYRIL